MIKRLVSAFSLLCTVVGSAFSQSMIISGGSDHAVAICDKGLIYAWGNNDKGQLCLKGSQASESVVAKPAEVNIKAGLTFSQVSAGSGGHNIALSCKKTVYCWGDNENDQCGIKNQQYVSDEPNLIAAGEAAKEHGVYEDGTPGGPYLGDVKFVCATTQACMAILNDGTAVWWGANSLLGSAKTSEPMYITDKSGQRLQNIIHIMGGDDNMMIIVGDSPDAQVGTVYSAGGWNGRGGTDKATDEYAAPVEIAGTTPTVSSKQPLTNVRTTGIADVGAYAVDGSTGYVYGWGNNGWGCTATGGQPQGQFKYATKVVAGEYEEINGGQAYLTDVKQVIGGNGYGAAITEDGYLLYWGNNLADGKGNSGGVIPSGLHKSDENTCKTGPVFAYYCAGEKGAKEVRVDDAVSIGRGDMCGFMVNKDGKYYVWGSSNIPGKNTWVGTMGTGNAKDQSWCLKEIEIPCAKPDICPEPFLNGPRYKCPGEIDSIDCGFTPIKGREDNYFFIWKKDGVVLNTSTETSPVADRRDDKYNSYIIGTDEPGLYEVEVLYIGTNVPCDNCPEAKAKLELIDMEMPLDTIITDMNCVADPLKPKVTDLLKFEATVNDKFYTGTKKAQTTWALFSTVDSKDTLGVSKPKNGAISFTVTGDKIAASEVHENVGVDTTYTVWVEDVTQFETMLHPKTVAGVKSCSGNYYGNFTQIIKLPSNAMLKSFSLFAEGNQMTPGLLTVTPVIYKGGKETSGGYTLGDIFWTGKKQNFDLDKADGIQECVVECNVTLPANSTRGTEYILAMEFKIDQGGYYVEKLNAETDVFFGTPYDDTEKFGIQAIGSTANQIPNANPGRDNPFWNITFGKMTDYDCGRIMLTAKYGCPPCNKPENEIKIASTVKPEATDTVFICKETGSTTLSVDGVVNVANAGVFDIIWADDFSALAVVDDAGALKADLEKSASEIEVNWADITPGSSKTYYVKIRDNEKPDAAGCWIFDSVTVKAVKVPEVPAITIEPFCEGADVDFTQLVAGITTIPNLTFEKLTRENKDFAGLLGVALVPADMKALPAGEHAYVVYVSDAHGCKNEGTAPTDSIKVTVNAIPTIPTVTENPIEALKETSGKLPLEGTVVPSTPGNTVLWATDQKTLADSTKIAPVVSLDKADTITYYVMEVSPAGCKGDTTSLTIIINDAPAPRVKDDSICLNGIPDFSALVTPQSSDYQIFFYETEADALSKDPSKRITPSFDSSMPGKKTYYATQMNLTTNAESSPSSFSVTAFGVNPVDVLKDKVKYCKGATDAVSVEQMVTGSKSGFYQADDLLVWKNELKNEIKGNDLIPNTNVSVSTTYTYYVNQTFTISPSKVCVGPEVSVTAVVPVIPALPTNSVIYVSSEAKENGGKFPTLLEKKPDVATPATGNSLQWYDDKQNPVTDCPAPEYKPNDTKDVTYTFYVSQKDADGCESELTPIEVVVSASPSPTPNHVELCEDDDVTRATPLTAELGLDPSGTAEYELLWFGMEDPAEWSNEDKNLKGSTTAPAPTEATWNAALASDRKVVYTYYVAQRNKDTKAVGMAQKLNVTVYQKPQVVLTNPQAVCKPQTIDLGSKEIWASSSDIASSDIYVKSWYFGSNYSSTVPNPTKIEKSGPYDAMVYFEVNGKACESDVATINVDIHSVDDLVITGADQTCPNTQVTLKAEATIVGSNSITYTWDCTLNGDHKVVTGDPEYTTPALQAGLAQREYVYTLKVTAGACEDIAAAAPHVISIGDGPVAGSVFFTEDGNANAGSMTPTAAGLTYYSCGNPLTISVADVEHTENNFTWTENGVATTGSTTLQIAKPEGKKVYHVNYTNKCLTGFDITVNSVPVSVVALDRVNEICEGEDYLHIITPVCGENTYKITWSKDGKEIPATDTRFNNAGVNIEKAQPTDNGVYSYVMTNRGCSFEGVLNQGKALKVKPEIKFTFDKEQYVARRDSILEIPLNITVPADGNLQLIQWKSDGIAFDKGNPLQLPVKSDNKLSVVLQDPEYCDASGNVNVVMDGRLKLSLSAPDNLMCYGETRVMTLDTAGTGNLYYKDRVKISLIETVDGDSREITNFNLALDGKLYLNISPKKDAKYVAKFEYRPGEGVDRQYVEAKFDMQVLEPIEIEILPVQPICADGETEMEVPVSVKPAGTIVTWNDDPDIVSGLEGNTIIIAPDYGTRPGNTYSKLFRFSATYSVCDAKEDIATVVMHRPLTGEIKAPEIICEGTSTTLDASSYDSEIYKWISENDPAYKDTLEGPASIKVAPLATSLYNLFLTRGVCSAEDEFELIISQKPEITEIDSVSYNSRLVTVQGGADPYYYWIDKVTKDSSSNNLFEKIVYGSHKVIVIDAAGCSDTAKFVVRAPELTFQQIVSPNGDNVNDFFTSDVLQNAFPNATISIFDRWGKKLVEMKGADAGWDGTYNGTPMPSTDYWYEVEIKELKKTYTGHFTLMRQ